jgi:hypothetical protein
VRGLAPGRRRAILGVQVSHGDPAIYFRIVVTDDAEQRYPPTELTGRIEDALIKDLELFTSEYSVYLPYFNYRTKMDEDRLKDPKWQ